MKIKTIVGIALSIAIFTAGNILLFGLVTESFTIIYFVFAAALISLIIAFSRKSFTISDFIFLLFVGVLFCAFLALFSSSVKSFHEKSVVVDSARENLSYEIAAISAKNAYYNDYVKYQLSQIERYRNMSDALHAQIEQMINMPAVQPVQPVLQSVIQPVVESTVVQQREEEEYEDD